MPTPSEPTLPPSPPVEASSSRASFASCPPEDERPHLGAMREEELDALAAAEEEYEGRQGHEDMPNVQQEPTPEPEIASSAEGRDARAGTGADTLERISQSHDKGEHVEDTGAVDESLLSASATPEVPSGLESDTAQSRYAHASPSSEENDPLYLHFPCDRDRVGSTHHQYNRARP